MTDGLPSKIGNWYEEDYLLLQLLELLQEEVQSVEWEPPVPGLDIEIRKAGATIGVQCKHRSPTQSWTWQRLRDRGVPRHAKSYLEGHETREYHFVGDQPARELGRLSESAREILDPAAWWSEFARPGQTLAGEWSLDPTSSETPAVVHGLVRRIHVRLLNRPHLDEQCRTLSRYLAGVEGERLLDVLRRTALSSVELRTPVRVEDLRAAIADAGVVLQPRAFDPLVHDRLSELAQAFREEVDEVRFLEPIERAEVSLARDELDSMKEPGTLLIHGPAGCGKTEVISGLIEVLDKEGWVVLAATPERLPHLNRHEDPAATLKRHAGTRRAVLVIDQLDAILRAGSGARTLLAPTKDILSRARDYGVYVVAGCRSVDADRETQLRQMLQTWGGEEPGKVAVGDLDEAAYGKILSEAGVALTDLQPRLRDLAPRPIYLRLICQLLGQGVDLSRIDGLPHLTDAWWGWVEGSLESEELEFFDEIVDRMEREGRLRVRREGLTHPGMLPALLTAGLMTEESNGKLLRPTHQLLVDMRIAHRWRRVSKPKELLEKLGGIEEQSLHTAGRLRLTMPLLRDHSRAVACIKAVAESEGVRPLLKQSLYKALADVEDPRPGEVAMLMDWYRDPAFGARVLSLVVRGSPGWTAGLAEAGWFEDIWRRGGQEERDLALDLLAAVSETWGDGVADHLRRWAADDPDVLRRASWIFLQAPGKDTDRLFEIRLDYAVHNPDGMALVDWSKLLTVHPERVVRLLAARLPIEEVGALTRNEPQWAQLFPGTNDPSLASASELGRTAWDHLRVWWVGLAGVELDRVQVAEGMLPNSLLVRLVELLGRSLAFALDHQQLMWRDLVQDLPTPLRDLDGWLLLRTATALVEEGTGAPEAVINWLRSDDRWAEIEIGYRGLRRDLARECVRTLSRLASDDGYRELEDWIVNYQDTWTPKDEARRWSNLKEYGALLPSLRGALAYHLIPALEAERRSPRTRRLFRELDRKFTRDHDAVFPTCTTSGGRVDSPVPHQAAAKWSPSRWKAELSRAPEVGTWPAEQKTPNLVRVHKRSTLLGRLFDLAHRNPRGFLEHAREFSDPEFDPEIATRARRRILLAIDGLTPPNMNPPVPDWEPLSDTELASVVCIPTYLLDENLASAVGRIVRERPSHHWPEEVIARLEEIAGAPPVEPSDGTREFGLSFDRLNDDGNIALDALAALAWRQPEHRPRVLDLAEGHVDDPNPARRAAATIAAWAAREADMPRTDRLLLRAADDPEVAAQHNVCSYLLHLVGPEQSDAGTAASARSRLLALAADPRPHVAEWGGKVLVVLRELQLIDDEEITAHCDAGVEVRRGLADHVARYLAQGNTDEWLCRLGVRLGDDEDDQVRSEIARMFSFREADHLLEHRRFIDELKGTRALREAPYDLLKLFDRNVELTPVASTILDLVRNLDLPPGAETGYAARHLSAGQACEMLFRLTEEAERTGDLDLRSKALDAWDRLLTDGSFPAARHLEELWRGS